MRIGTKNELLERADMAEIVARGINPAMFSDATAGDGLVQFRVSSQRQREAIEQVWAAGGEIVRVNPVRRTLEEIFLELTRAEANQPGGQA